MRLRKYVPTGRTRLVPQPVWVRLLSVHLLAVILVYVLLSPGKQYGVNPKPVALTEHLGYDCYSRLAERTP